MTRTAETSRSVVDLIWKIAPLGLVIVMTSLILGGEIISPNPRVIKVGVLFLLLIIMLRFEMTYSLYFFLILFPFPSGIAMTSTNVLLITHITLLWIIRANSLHVPLLKRTALDKLILLFLFAYLVSFLNVESARDFNIGLQLLWRQLAAFALFYLIVRFVDDERKLVRITKVIAVAVTLLALTALVELFFPGRTIIPGWIGLAQRPGMGELGYRMQGVRLHGSVDSHAVLSDFCSLTLLFVGLHMIRSRNPFEKSFWLVAMAITLTVLIATANRGAAIALAMGLFYALYVLRRRLNLIQMVIIVTSIIAVVTTTQFVLTKYTNAVSLTERLMATTFEKGVVPHNRVGAWLPALERSKEHIFIGHGPSYSTRSGMEKRAWPHNSFIYTLHTLGLFGLGIYLFILFRLFMMSRRYAARASLYTYAGLILSLLHVQIVMQFLAQMRTDYQRNSDYVYIFIVWTLFGLIVATTNVVRKQLGETTAEESQHPR